MEIHSRSVDVMRMNHAQGWAFFQENQMTGKFVVYGDDRSGGGRLAVGDEPSAQPSDHEGSRHAVEPCERKKKGLMVEPLPIHWIAPAGSVLRSRRAGWVSLGP